MLFKQSLIAAVAAGLMLVDGVAAAGKSCSSKSAPTPGQSPPSRLGMTPSRDQSGQGRGGFPPPPRPGQGQQGNSGRPPNGFPFPSSSYGGGQPQPRPSSSGQGGFPQPPPSSSRGQGGNNPPPSSTPQYPPPRPSSSSRGGQGGNPPLSSVYSPPPRPSSSSAQGGNQPPPSSSPKPPTPSSSSRPAGGQPPSSSASAPGGQPSSVPGGASGSGQTTRYWDCCKPSCAWPGKASVSSPVGTCDKSDAPLSNANADSACNGGTSYMCSNESPWAVNDDLAYGFAAVKLAGGSESTWCCACYELTFTSGPVSGKKMIVQATNTGGDLGNNHFDIAMPGGGVGIYNACSAQYGAPSSGWGAQYGGISSRSDCDNFPAKLKDGCYWRFDWFKGADNPGVTFKEVSCPSALTAKTGCKRT